MTAEERLYNLTHDVEGQSEDQLQQKCFYWFHNTYPTLRGLLFHVPNGGARNPREAKKFKQMGVYSGVADLLLIYQGTIHCLELKTSTGKQRKAQIDWADTVGGQGIDYYIVRSLEGFKEVVKAILSLS